MVNGALPKWLSKAVVVVASWQVALRGGVVRFGSFCFRHAYGMPA